MVGFQVLVELHMAPTTFSPKFVFAGDAAVAAPATDAASAAAAEPAAATTAAAPADAESRAAAAAVSAVLFSGPATEGQA